jgi:cytoskeletal protein RodZ
MEQKKQPNKKQKLLIALLLLIILLLLGLLCWQVLGPKEDQPAFEREVNAKLGQLEGKSESEIQEELNRVVEEGMFHISINTDPVFADGKSEGSLEIENVPGNQYLMRVEITLDDTGELVYSTRYIEPDYHIQKAALDVELEKGEYPATAVFYAYDPESLTEMGSASAKINLIILN